MGERSEGRSVSALPEGGAGWIAWGGGAVLRTGTDPGSASALSGMPEDLSVVAEFCGSVQELQFGADRSGGGRTGERKQLA